MDLRRVAAFLSFTLATLWSATLLSGCVMVGHSSTGGWFIFPPIGIIVLIVLFLLLRRR